MGKDRDSLGRFKKGFRHPKKRIEINLKLLKEKYISGKSTYDLGNIFRVNQKTIHNRLKELGILRTRSEALKLAGKKISRTMKERGIHPKQGFFGTPWNKGKKLHYKVWNEGKTTGQKNWKNRIFTKETIEKIKKARAKQIFPLKDTSIEIKIQTFLKHLHIEFFTHQYMNIEHGYQCDIYIPSIKTIIEADGCYWHGCPICKLNTYKNLKKRKKLDRKRTAELKSQGFKVLRLWEHEIKEMNINDFKKKIFIGQVFK